jgi:hypothetical protein
MESEHEFELFNIDLAKSVLSKFCSEHSIDANFESIIMGFNMTIIIKCHMSKQSIRDFKIKGIGL